MVWYVCPIFVEAPTEENPDPRYLPGIGLPGAVIKAPSLGAWLAHAHDPKLAPETALIGLLAAPPVTPAGWTAKTLAEAQAHFTAVCGRAPAASEVW